MATALTPPEKSPRTRRVTRPTASRGSTAAPVAKTATPTKTAVRKAPAKRAPAAETAPAAKTTAVKKTAPVAKPSSTAKATSVPSARASATAPAQTVASRQTSLDGLERREAALRMALRDHARDLKNLRRTIKRQRIKLDSLKVDLAKTTKKRKAAAKGR
jgi:hypothetical protein